MSSKLIDPDWLPKSWRRYAWVRSVAVYLHPRVLSIFFLGIVSGLPLPLVYWTLSAWLTEEGVSKTAIGLFSWASTAYGFKYLWSPLVDRVPLPILTRLLGRRRSWMIFSQLLVIGAILGLGSTDPSESIFQTALWAVILAFASATQDIVIDAYRTEILEESQLGAGAANIVAGYRTGMLIAGAGALLVAQFFGWFWAFVAMAVVMAFGMVTVLLTPEPDESDEVQRRDQESEEQVALFLQRYPNLPRSLGRAGSWLYGTVIAPFREFMTRPAWLVILLFVAFYKYGDALLGVMANPFYLEIGFSKAEIAVISKSYGLAMTLTGAFAGGALVARIGIMRSLLIAGILQAVSNLIYCLQAWIGYSVPMLTVTISVENLSGGLATAIFVAYLSSLCDVAYTATQYALLSSFSAFARTFFASAGGVLADHMNWVNYFLVTTIAAVPGLALLLWMMKRFPPEEELPQEPEGAPRKPDEARDEPPDG